MAFRSGRKLSKEEAAQVQSRSRGSLEEYEQVFGDLADGEGFTYEIEAEQKSITERSRWSAVADRQGHNFKFTSKKDRSTGQSTITVIKGSAKEGAAPRSRRSS
ncbi:MAG TPA: hypothetical protein VH593_02025 [Ktedonobacteraceae bacterium]|jgi:hypothetical protein